MMSNKESKKDNFVIKGIYLGGIFSSYQNELVTTWRRAKTMCHLGDRPQFPTDRRKFRWAHRGDGLCRGHKDGLFEVLIQPQMGIDSYLVF